MKQAVSLRLQPFYSRGWNTHCNLNRIRWFHNRPECFASIKVSCICRESKHDFGRLAQSYASSPTHFKLIRHETIIMCVIQDVRLHLDMGTEQVKVLVFSYGHFTYWD